MFYLILFSVELFFLLLLSRKFHQRLSNFLFTLVKNKKLTVYITAIIFLPGTLIHELSHFIVGLFLLVPVGDLVFIPKIENDSVKLGSVSVAKTDPFRRFLIGCAPLLIGTSIILFTIYYLVLSTDTDLINIVLAFYVAFEVGNTMFLSKKDLEGAWKIYLFLVLVLAILYLLGFSLSPETIGEISGSKLAVIFEKASIFLLVPLFIDLSFIGLLKFFK